MPSRSGFCNPANPLDSHMRCEKSDCPCDCPKHQPPEVTPVDPEPEPAAAATTLHAVDAELFTEPPAPSLEDAIEVFVLAAEQVNTAALEIVHMKPDVMLRRLYRLRQGLEHALVVDASLVRQAYLDGEHGDVRLDDLPAAKVQRGRERSKWDERGVAQAVIDQRMAERGFEVVEDPWTVAEWLLEVFGVGYCRVTPLRAMGLDPEHFCESTPGKVSVAFID